MLDLGANLECDAKNLVQFAFMGQAFANIVMGVKDPSVSLLNIGEEEQKGLDYIREASKILISLNKQINYRGFIEGDKIAQGLSHKANFIRYTYREEMVMDAVENCLKAIRNYNIDAATRTGAPNAFAYFTQICYYAFLRRLAKEKKQQDIKFKFIEKAGIEDFVHYDRMNSGSDSSVTRSFVDQLRERIEVVRSNDKVISDFAKEEKKKKPPKAKAGVELFMG